MKVYTHNGKVILVNGKAIAVASVVSYTLIEPIDPVAFPTFNGLHMVTLDGSETWRVTSGGAYTEDYGDLIKNQSRDAIVGFCKDYDFLPSVQGIASMTDDSFIFNGTSSVPVNGNLSFKNSNTTSASAWTDYLAEHPITILISTNAPDASVWRPAKRDTDGVTGYWNGGNGFVAVRGGIPYLGDNLVTDEVVEAAYTNAWISTSYVFTTASNSTSFVVPVTDGAYYRAEWDSVDSAVAGTIFRYGFTDNHTPGSGNTLSAPRDRSTPQDTTSIDIQASGDYMAVQVASGTFPGNVNHITVREMIGYEPPVLLMMGGNPNPNPEPEPEGGEE